MHVGLADVLVHGFVGDVAHAVTWTITFCVERLIVVSDAGKQCGRRLIAILACDRGVGLGSLKLRAVLPGPCKSIFQRKAERWRHGRRSLLRIFRWCGARRR